MQRPPCGAVVLLALTRAQGTHLAVMSNYGPANITANSDLIERMVNFATLSCRSITVDLDPINGDAARGINLPDPAVYHDGGSCHNLTRATLTDEKRRADSARPPSLNRPVGLETGRSYERPRRPVGPNSLRRSCGRSSSKPRRPQPSVFPQPPSPGSSAPADRCRGYSCPRPLADPTD